MREEMDNKLEAFLKEIKSNKSASMVTNPRSDVDEIQDPQLSGSKTHKSIAVHTASNNENPDSESDDYPVRASKMKDLKHPAKPLFQNESDVDITVHSNEESDEEDYHRNHRKTLQVNQESSTRFWGACLATDVRMSESFYVTRAAPFVESSSEKVVEPGTGVDSGGDQEVRHRVLGSFHK